MKQKTTLLTAQPWQGQCPPMPGRNGPTYKEQIAFVEKWMAPLMRKHYESRNWRRDPHLIFQLYRQLTEYAQMFEPQGKQGSHGRT